ncbi:MAG: Ku protein [Deltaproteobacteria bacterium]|nr:Ku protein [Deltaproteobacteria bacterium]
MGARAMWKGVLVVGDDRVPVKMYAALEDRAVHFRLLHAEDGAPVSQQLVDPHSEEPVEREDVARGVALGDDRFVLLDEGELAALDPEPSREVEILRVVPPEAVDDAWYDRPYWLGPDGDDEGYAALAAALEGVAKLAVVRWTMRRKRYQGALTVRDGRLALVRLRNAEEIVPIEALEAPKGREPSDKERGLARQLVEALAEPFDPDMLHDDYRERVRALLERKARGETIEVPERREREATEDERLAEALGASLKRAAGG